MPNPDFKGAPLGNKNGEKKNRVVTDTLRRVAAQNPEKLRSACEALLDKAAAGDVIAYKEIRDTLDGKPMQSVEMNVTRTTANMADSELARVIAESSRSRATRKANGKEEPDSVH